MNSPALSCVIDRAQILKAAASIGILGAGAQSAPRILAALCKEDTDAPQVVGLIREEPAIYARVLRVANSPYYGQSRSIKTVDRALVVLGLDAVRGIAAAACFERSLPRGGPRPPVDLGALMNHSLATAAAAQSLALLQEPALAADAFIAGLLHNLGIVVQMRLDSRGILDLITRRQTDATGDMRALEAARCTVGHEECVAVVFEEWQLPPSLVAATRHHHDPMGAAESHRKLAALINLGANLGLASGSTFTLEPEAGARHVPAMAWLGLSGAQLDQVAASLAARTALLRGALREA